MDQRRDGVRFCAYLTRAQQRQSILSDGLGMGGKTWTQRGERQSIRGEGAG